MGKESALWRNLRLGMKHRWNAQRHEDRFSEGVPDVSYAIGGRDGWIELKAAPQWPVRPTTPLRVHMTPQQVLWLEQRGRAGNGRCFILLRVDRDYLLLTWHHARAFQEGLTQEELIIRSRKNRWEGRINFEELAMALSK